MSEYQYYEFLALDRPLDERQLREVDALSSRAEVSTTRWVNTYNYGSFRGDETRFVTDYFDAMIYVANWGTRRFSVGLPADRVDDEQILLHATGDALSAELVTGKVVVDLCSETEDPSGWEDGSGWMASLAPVRSRLLGGDTHPTALHRVAAWSRDGRPRRRGRRAPRARRPRRSAGGPGGVGGLPPPGRGPAGNGGSAQRRARRPPGGPRRLDRRAAGRREDGRRGYTSHPVRPVPRGSVGYAARR